MKKYIHSFLVARFQPFHNGHKSLIDKMLNESKYATIIVGSAQDSKSSKNIFNAEERIYMLKNVYGEKENMNIFPLNDIPSDDEWYGYVMQNLAEKSKKFGKVEAFYCGGIDEGKWFDKGELKIEMLDRNTQIGNLKISGTEIRNMIKNNDNLWKNYVPQQNINFIENYIKKNKNN